MTNSSQEIIYSLTSQSLGSNERAIMLRRFAEINGWRPSDEILEYPGTELIANGHLIVEHGLEISAVITFLKSNVHFPGLSENDQLHLLSISYNNLAEWHFFPDPHGLTLAFNRKEPIESKRISLDDNVDVWRAEQFDRIIGRRPTPNLKSLDDALIETLSIWKRLLRAEIQKRATNVAISELFNSILLIRALEDYRRARNPNERRLLLETWINSQSASKKIRICISNCLQELKAKNIPKSIIDKEKLRVFDSLDQESVRNLFNDFYDNKFAPYKYDFSLMSKHALSRIYEHYVSLLREKMTPQLSIFPQVPEEVTNRSLGAFYTPQFIARFFARYLKENLPPRKFRTLKVSDPTCGSGIFLRTLLEMQCDPFQEVNIQLTTSTAFKNIFGVDIEPNACKATQLSLSLLYLVIMGEFPRNLNIKNVEVIDYFMNHPKLKNCFDAVIANPPFIPWDRLKTNLARSISLFLAGYGKGKLDMYLAILKVGMDMLRPGGFLLYVLPHAFLHSRNGLGLRSEISNNFWIRFVADLSEVAVFDDSSSYTILLVIQKKPSYEIEAPAATIVLCKEFAGHALQDAIEGRRLRTDFYEIFDVPQSIFSKSEWRLLPPRASNIWMKLSRFPTINQFLYIRQGFITGADDVFIREKRNIPDDEKDIYKPYLADRKMRRFSVPKATIKEVFYPYIDGNKINLNILKRNYPKTYKYLKSHYNALKARKSVLSGNTFWWCPVRPRLPQNMFRPKLITPHLIILPRFSLDANGKYGVSHCPILYAKARGDELQLLRYFLAILNSSVSFWQLSHLSHKYSHGYSKLEVASLSKLAVPDPGSIPVASMTKIQNLVKFLISNPESDNEYRELDNIIADLYKLSKTELQEIGIV